jgi:hypothetical protein
MVSSKNILVALAVFISVISFAQEVHLDKDVNIDIDLIIVYEAYVADGYGTPEICKKRANGNYFEDNYKAVVKWCQRLFETESPIKKEHAYR